MKKVLFLLCILTFMMVITACSSNEQDEGSETEGKEDILKIYTTLYAWEAFAEKIGGEYAEVENLVPAGADVHSFEPTAQTLVDVAEADAFIYNGAGMDGFADAINETAEEEGTASIKVTEDMALQEFTGHDHEAGEEKHEENSSENEDEHNHAEEEEAHEHGEGESHEEEDHAHSDQDPHVWLDPLLAAEGAEKIKNEFIELMPEHKEDFEENYAELQNDLNELDEEFTAMAESAEKDTFLVSHAGYGYWEDRYGINQIGISGLSPNNEPSQKDLQSIIALAEENNLNYVMFEQNVSSKVAEVVQEEAGAEALSLHNLESLTEKDIESKEDYFSIMRSNIENLKTALSEGEQS
ncbi:metal ABC transporter solute-binding protein, Zn/Mn family [Alteribacillus sp. HJP-4]|uniref:metal ABC transporter solute-binding protein, Zn/Mn family n=1 Tax=Alteribacillus sp. HJP-4 TaxID=2775394 RepID=UPI0035CD2A39